MTNLPKLGKAAPRKDPRTLKLAYYLPALPVVPAQMDYSTKVNQWGMMLNDQIGDCTCAAAGHLIEQWTANASQMATPTDDQILAAYEAIGGYNPNDPSTDNGCVVLDVLNYWRQNGIAGHKIGCYAEVSHANLDHVKAGLFIFGGVYVGVQLPLSAQGQAIWDVPAGGAVGDGAVGSWGGHAIEAVAYDADYITVITWGAPMKVTWAFWNTYVDEAYAIISQDFLEGNGETPEGFNLNQLTADLKLVTD